MLHSITLTTYNLLYYNILAKILSSYLGIILDKILGKFLARSWRELGRHNLGILGKFLASSWQVLGKFLARSWQVPGKFVASSWQESCPRIRCWGRETLKKLSKELFSVTEVFFHLQLTYGSPMTQSSACAPYSLE